MIHWFVFVLLISTIDCSRSVVNSDLWEELQEIQDENFVETWSEADYTSAEPMDLLFDTSFLVENSFKSDNITYNGRETTSKPYIPKSSPKALDYHLYNSTGSKNKKRAINFVHPVDGPFTHEVVVSSNQFKVSYPYRLVGKLFFKKPNGRSATCSASIIQKRIVATAAHCVYTTQFHTDFRFAPNFVDGVAPYGTWRLKKAWISKEWIQSTSVPNQYDFALLLIRDQPVPQDSESSDSPSVQSIGELLGWFGMKLNALEGNHVTSLGYPVDFDNGQKMHKVTSQYRRTRNPQRTIEYPNDMGKGASGGPWISDFGVLSEGRRGNWLVGLSSYRDKDPARMYLGSPHLSNEFKELFDMVCNEALDNCQVN
eukprot:TRINITY_DN3427_c0_g1_i6.p1 TRINITY_DN3427_c0_g1~~TRINITY_DN3427_c0_g1_i6.p1  ORF type:complete len:370 (-),score=41.00 TRINITY_DN3427_c0_g1_i6:44-1153(-)